METGPSVALVAQGIERRPPEPGAQVRILPRAPAHYPGFPMALQDVLPQTWTETDGRAEMGGVPLDDLARRYGTPAYVYDLAHLENRLAEFTEAFAGWGIPVYASKAFMCTALAELLAEAGWWVDVASAGEVALARSGGVASGRLLLHGNLKTDEELRLAIDGSVGLIAVDSLHEAGRLQRLAETAQSPEPAAVMVRLNVETGLRTHRKVLTSGADAKFGMPPAVAGEAASRLADAPGLRLRGAHLHAGSHIADPAVYGAIVSALVEFAAAHRPAFREEPVLLNVGGGMAAPYLRSDPFPTPGQTAGAIAAALADCRAEKRLGPVTVMLEPGRSLVANAGVLLYTAGVRKTLPGGGEMLALDGGMTDNPRPALYGSRYELLPAVRSPGGEAARFQVFGRSCESDLLLDGAELPADMGPGRTVAMPAAGAYSYSMSSRYNALPRPPVLFVKNGKAREVVCRESPADLLGGQRGLRAAPAWSPEDEPDSRPTGGQCG